MGVFFDGSNNCMHNMGYYRARKDDFTRWNSAQWEYSDETNCSNVALLYKAYKHSLDGNHDNGFDYVRRVYISGFDEIRYRGNKRGAYDMDRLKKEVISKVRKTCEIISRDITHVIDVASESFPIERVNLTLDVYGGGRGATVARCFLNCLEEPHENIGEKETSLSYWFDQLEYRFSEEETADVSIDVRFLGLYDTTSPLGVSDDVNFNDILGIDGEDSPASSGVHFCAADEYRAKYSLITTDSYSNIEQYIFPGSHSDIGGGYNNVVYEPLEFQFFNNLRLVGKYLTGFREMPDFVKEGWYNALEDADGKISVEKEREVVNTYSLIFLFLMEKKADEDGLGVWNQNALCVSKALLAEDSFLETVRKRMEAVVSGKPLYGIYGQAKCPLGEIGLEMLKRFREGNADAQFVKELRSRYIHLSSNPVWDKSSPNSNIRLIIKG